MLTAASANADFTFGEPVNLGSVVNGSSSSEAICCVSSDGLEMYIESDRAGGYGDWDLWVLKRTAVDKDWGPPENLGPVVNTPIEEGEASMSADGLTLYFSSSPGRFRGGNDIFLTTRATRNSPWRTPVNLGPTVNSSAIDVNPWISTDGLELYFGSYRAGGYGRCDIYVARRATESDPWGVPVNLGPSVNSAYEDQFPCLSADGLLLFFSDHNINLPRPGGYGNSDMWVSMHPTTQGSWGAPVNLGPQVNGPYADHGPRVSPDGLTLYFSSLDRPGGYGGWDIWQAPIIPLVDFNGDETVDINDLVILIEHWGQDESSVDIGPMPWGDGKVDAADLEVLMSYWGQEVNDPTLVAHWKLDEAEGTVAADSVRGSNGTLVGSPLWQPAGGKLGGALQLDGVGSYVKAPFVCDPSQGPFSVFAWVKGGTPGQAVLSQAGGANWLMAGATDGALTTELRQAGRQGKPLTSSAVITDGAWHRVGFVWDGSNRILYLDGVEIAKDTQSSLAASGGGLCIGAGSGLSPGAFWSGLIDDVRIYDRAAKP
jgi:hypothetical protein